MKLSDGDPSNSSDDMEFFSQLRLARLEHPLIVRLVMGFSLQSTFLRAVNPERSSSVRLLRPHDNSSRARQPIMFNDAREFEEQYMRLSAVQPEASRVSSEPLLHADKSFRAVPLMLRLVIVFFLSTINVFSFRHPLKLMLLSVLIPHETYSSAG